VEVSELEATLRAQVDRLVSEFESRYSREQIAQSVQDSGVRYQDARITAFIPILVYRDARAILLGSHEATRVGMGSSGG
jgi:hypothetical protein